MEVGFFTKVYNSRRLRREALLTPMEKNSNEDIGCKQCDGRCCTFRANSMMLTPIEAIDLRAYFYENDLWDEMFEHRLHECIKEFRLDEGLSLGRGRSFRRTYTCPFFLGGFPGCPIPLENKPYGCLAFNPTRGNPEEGESCSSLISNLHDREFSYDEEDIINEKMRKGLNLDWEKLPIPLALLDIDSKLRDDEDILNFEI